MFDRVLESKTAHASIILHNRNKMNSYTDWKKDTL